MHLDLPDLFPLLLPAIGSLIFLMFLSTVLVTARFSSVIFAVFTGICGSVPAFLSLGC